MSFAKLLAFCLSPLFLVCLDVPRPLLTDAQPYSYAFSGVSREKLFDAASAVLKAQGYDIASAEKYTWTITTYEQRLPLTDQDCDCATDAGIVYYNTKNTTTEVVLTLSIYADRIVFKNNIIRKFITPEEGYGKRFYCVSKGTIENDLFRKISSTVQGGF
ncbi:MAG: hypothetical protein JXA71_16940 [Chitinispirillaceae bacterium]|nr:hypothetical protein [Chitinispirillaceae bacterium]